MQKILDGFYFGLLFPFGLLFGAILCLFAFKQISKMRPKRYRPHDLEEPFQKYKTILEHEENYEEMARVNLILEVLKKGNLPDDVKLYEIKASLSFSMENKYPEGDQDEDGQDVERSSYELTTKYRVIGLKQTK